MRVSPKDSNTDRKKRFMIMTKKNNANDQTNKKPENIFVLAPLLSSKIDEIVPVTSHIELLAIKLLFQLGVGLLIHKLFEMVLSFLYDSCHTSQHHTSRYCQSGMYNYNMMD